MKRIIIFTMVAAFAAVGQAWTLLDNFETYDNSADTHTTVATGGVWTSVWDGTNNSHIIDRDVEHGQVLQTTGGAAWRGAERDLSASPAAVPVGAVMTYYWQVRPWYTSDGSGWDYDFMMGLAPSVDSIDEFNAWQDFAIMPFINNEALTPYINADAPTSPWWAPMNPNTWYNVWVVIRNDAVDPDFDLYYATDDTPILVAGNANWRNFDVNVDLNAIGFMAAGNVGTFFDIDNICYAVGEDLTLPGSFEYPKVQNQSPAYGATLISVDPNSPSNDLVFEVVDSNVVEVDVQLAPENDPNLTDDPAGNGYKIVDGMAVTPGVYTINLEAELNGLLWDTDYYWKVIGYEPNLLIPANGNDVQVFSEVWTFRTTPQTPLITSNPDPYTAVDPNGQNVDLTADGINGTFQWYKDGNLLDDPTDTLYVGETSGTLTIIDVQQEDEGYYTMKVLADPLEAESTPARVMIHRLTSYYDFEGTSVVDGNDVFVDSIDGYPAVLMQDSASAGLPTAMTTDANSLPGYTGYVKLDNADHDTDPNGQYLQIYPGVVDYEDITIALWVHPKSVQETWSHVWDFGDSDGEGPALFLNVDYGATDDNQGYNAYFDIDGQAVIADLGPDNWVDPGTWHYVVITISGDTGKIFVDGLWRNTETVTNNPIDLDLVMNYIGDSSWPDDQEWDGLIDELKIWNYGLTNEEIAQNYMTYTGDTVLCDTENNEITGLWRYDQGWNDDMGTPEDPGDDQWIGGNNNCRMDLADFAGLANRWLETWQFYPAP